MLQELRTIQTQNMLIQILITIPSAVLHFRHPQILSAQMNKHVRAQLT